MPVSLKHTTQAVGTDAGNGEIRKTQWNEEHTLTLSADKVLGRATSGAGAVEEIDCTAAGRALLDDADAAAQRATLGLTIGSNVQAWDADLDAIAAIPGTSGFLKKTAANTWALDTANYSPVGHTHIIADVTGLQAALDGKQAAGSYAAASHTHAIADVTGLQTALDGKQAAGSYAAASHTHAISDVTNLQASLDAKAPLNGTGTSGTWPISITGNANYANTAGALTNNSSNWVSSGVGGNVVGLMGWKNYGNNHVIIDASNGTAPNGAAINNTNAQNAWFASCPTLVGWNGAQTYGIRVDYCRWADGANYADYSTSRGWTDYSTLIATTQHVADRVYNHMANMGYQGVGAYILARRVQAAGNNTGGNDLVSGSVLRPASGIGGNFQAGNSLSGTWRGMGVSTSSSSGIDTAAITLYVRAY